MGEIKTKPIELTENQPYIARQGDVVFGEEHTISDVIRYLADCSSLEEVQCLVEIMIDETRVITNRQAYEKAAGYNLCDMFFTRSGIDPDAEYVSVLPEEPNP